MNSRGNRLLSFLSNTNIETEDGVYHVANMRWKNVLNVDTSNMAALSQLSSNYIHNQQFSAAKATIQKLSNISESKNGGRLYELKARYAAARGDQDDVLSNWELAIQNGFPVLSAYAQSGSYCLSVDDIESARQYATRALDEDEAHESSRLLLARCFVTEHKWDDAVHVIGSIDNYTDYKKNAINLLFDCYTHSYQYEKAQALCDSLANDEVLYHYFQGRIDYNEHRHAEAIEHFKKSIEIADHVQSKVWLTKTYCINRDHKQAEDFITTIDCSNPENLLTVARCWEAAGVMDLAENSFNRNADENGGLQGYLPLIRFYYNNRYWGNALLTIEDAKKKNIYNTSIAKIEGKIRAAMDVSGIRFPRNVFRRKSFTFMSSESMVANIVDRVLSKKGSKSLCSNGVDSVKSAKKVVLIIGSLGPGGAERQAVNLSNGLVQRDNVKSVDLLCTHLSRTKQDRFYQQFVNEEIMVSEYYDSKNVISPYEIPELSEYAEFIEHIQPISRQQLIVHMAKSLIEIKPDVVHGWLDETFINTSLVCNMLGIDNIVGRWGSMPPGMGRRQSQKEYHNIRYLLSAYKQIARFDNLKYISNSRLTANAYAEMMGLEEEDVSIIYNGVDEQALLFQKADLVSIRAELGISDRNKVVGTVFRISEEKRPFLWVDTALEVQKNFPNCHFIIVGAGPFESQLQAYISKNGLINAHMVGKQSNVGLWYELFDVMLLTSRVEGVSNAVIESQLCGCPVVAPDVGGLSEALLPGETGFLLDSNQADEFASSVGKLIENDSLAQVFSERAVVFARNKFSVETLVRKTGSVYFD